MEAHQPSRTWGLRPSPWMIIGARRGETRASIQGIGGKARNNQSEGNLPGDATLPWLRSNPLRPSAGSLTVPWHAVAFRAVASSPRHVLPRFALPIGLCPSVSFLSSASASVCCLFDGPRVRSNDFFHPLLALRLLPPQPLSLSISRSL